MSDKAFNKNLPHRCEYCVNGSRLEGTREIICKKRGITDCNDYCRRYKYDPLKREPENAVISQNYTPEDFLI